MADPFIRDRGNIKWTSMMLPEHRKALIHLEKADEDVAEPAHDEDKLAELSEIISRAIYEEREVFLEYYKERRFCSMSGRIVKYEGAIQAIKVRTANGDWFIPVHHVIRVEAE